MNRVIQRGSRSLVQLRQSSSVAAKEGEKLSGKSLTPQTKFGPMSEKVKRLQQQFQDPLNDKPVYLKFGQRDVVLVCITAGLVAGGLINAAVRAYMRATGK